ncbi:glycine cleavage system protein GcvH [Sulfurospirillum arcachonense]|uniref:glycine cleavage system protein GcvH n=1 Tax=Sulfurospirillum arcachonense TaxID=57666 RepID=UPI00046A8CBE|nr:glycine cleavage system protein GcvH [Sulfurospirillum arcachonense]
MIKRYSNEHEWAILDADTASVGLSAYAVEQLGDITFVELPEIGASAEKDDSIAFIESVKAASDIYIPIGGEVIEVNEELEDAPELLNEAAESTWIMKIKVSDASEFDSLMDEASYKAYIETL